MFVTKLKIAAVRLLAATMLAASGLLSHGLTTPPQAEAKAEESSPKSKDEDKKDAKPVPVNVVKPKKGGLARTVARPARVIAAQQQQIVPLISGTIAEVKVDIGDYVKRGQNLIVLDAPLLTKEREQAEAALEMAMVQVEEAEAQVVTAQADVASAKAALTKTKAEKTLAQTKLKSAQELIGPLEKQFKSGQIPFERLTEARGRVAAAGGQIQLAEGEIAAAEAEVQVKMGKLAHARAGLKRAQANVKASRATLDKTRIEEGFTYLTAAFDGVITRRTADPGNFVQASDSRLLTPLLTLQRTDQMRVQVNVPGQYALLISRGDPVDLTFDSLPGVRITGQKIARFSPVLDDNLWILAEIDTPSPDGRLMPGMAGKITIHFKKRLANAFVVPSSCVAGILSEDNQRLVYVVRDGTAYLRAVKMTAQSQDEKNMEIVGDVKASDLIVTDAEKLSGKPGEAVPVEFKVEIKKGP